MSKRRDMIGPLPRALVSVPNKYHGTLLQVANKLGQKDTVKAARFAGDLKLLVRDEAVVAEQPKVKSPLLSPLGPVTVTLTEDHNPIEFYRTRKGLYVSKDFRERILILAQTTSAGTSITLNHSLLTRDMTNIEIVSALPEKYNFDVTTLCAVIAALIAEKPNTDRINLFYDRFCVVSVNYIFGRCEWHVNAWKVYAYSNSKWFSGNQVFYPIT